MISSYYVLNPDRSITPTNSILKAWDSRRSGLVGSGGLGKHHVLTHFLAINLASQATQPMVFETLILGPGHADFQRLYSSWEEAEHGHRAVLASLAAKARRVSGSPTPMAMTAAYLPPCKGNILRSGKL